MTFKEFQKNLENLIKEFSTKDGIITDINYQEKDVHGMEKITVNIEFVRTR